MIKCFPLFIFFILQGNIFSNVNYDSIIAGRESAHVHNDSTTFRRGSDSTSINSPHFPKDSTSVVWDSLKNKWISNSSTRDSLGLLTRAKNNAARDTVIPIFQTPVSNNGFILRNSDLQKNDYRYTPDYLKLFEFTYLAETGNLGFPDQLYLYGMQTYRTNYLKDGIALNDIPFIFFDLNYLQSETVDSIEIIPAPRGFLYGSYNKQVSVNFISKDFISINPYTRIKYYQGGFGEAMFDGIFNSVLYKKLFGFLDVTNRKLDQRFINSDFSSWQVTAKLRYLVSNSYNITGSYSYNKTYKGLNGGVNIDTLNLLGWNINTYLYDEIRAPVVNQLTDMDVTQHSFDLRLLAKPFAGSNTDFNLYYKFDGQSLNNIGDNSNDFEKTKNKLYGLSLNQKYNEDIYNINLIACYEHSDINLNFFPSSQDSINYYSYKVNLFSLAGIAGINISAKIKASIFYKYSSMMNEMLNYFQINRESKGVGFDVNINTCNELSFYLGYSLFQNYYSQNYLGNAEASAIFSLNNFYLRLSLFARNSASNNNPEFSNLSFPYLLLFNLQPYSLYTDNPYVMGIGENLRYKFWIMSFENNTSYYSGDYMGTLFRSKGLLGVLEIFSKSGIYISDSLFSSNLNLKSGFVFTYYGRIKYLNTLGSVFETNPAYTIDFTLAGRIKNAATVYFTWENLLDEKYYLIPYYPALGRNLRFGIAWDLFN
jgi:hypothetical protein